MDIINAIKVLTPAIASFCIGIAITPAITHYLYKYQCWKKQAGNSRGIGDQTGTPIFNELHKERDVNTPRMGGLVIVLSVIATVVLFWVVSYLDSGGPSGKIDFLSRTQTWIPFATFVCGALMGLIEDIAVIRTRDGIRFLYRLLPALGLGTIVAWWFYAKLGMTSILVPLLGSLTLGIWIIPFFLVVLLGVFASGVIDGLDGLSGGVLSIVFAAYGVIALLQNQINLSALCFVIVGAILAFLWFNIPPARFYMTEVGFVALALTLVVIAFMTGQVAVLPLIAFIQTITVITNIIQVASKKLFGKKVFRVAPIHHHFEAIGWSAEKIVMRYWVVSVIAATLGVVLTLV